MICRLSVAEPMRVCSTEKVPFLRGRDFRPHSALLRGRDFSPRSALLQGAGFQLLLYPYGHPSMNNQLDCSQSCPTLLEWEG